MELRTQIEGLSWDANVYAGLRQFHEAKGFDPASQDVARHMGYPLYRVSGAMDAPFAHAEEVATEEANDEESLKDLTEDEPAEQGNILHHPSDRDTEDPPVGSPWFNLVMHTQLALIIFLFICQMYDQLY
ncbi:hypothetical protein C8R46DRAFT_1092849 [Mycena filopes]|nr:hypothetical protein C8R46DRAFT_1092849 [Mycena filopes]